MLVQYVMATEPHESTGARGDASAEESGEEVEWELGGGKDGEAVEGRAGRRQRGGSGGEVEGAEAQRGVVREHMRRGG